MLRLMFALTLFAFTVLPYTSYAQFAASDEPAPVLDHGDYMVQNGAFQVSPEVVNIIAETLRPRLATWPDSISSSASGVRIAPYNDTRIDDARILRMNVAVRGAELQPSEAEMRQLWEVARKQLEAELNRITGEVAKSRRDRLQDELQRLEATRHSESDVTELIEQLAQRQAESAGAQGNFSQGLAEAFSKQRELKLRDAGLQARREAIERRIDEVRKVADESAAKDPVLAELEKLVEIRRRQLDAVQANHAVGRETASKVAEAEGELASSLVELARATNESAERASGGALRELNNELSKLLIETAEVEAQLKELEQILAEIRKNVREMALAMGEAENLKVKIKALRSRIAEEDARSNQLRREYEGQAPQSVTLRPLTVDKKEPAEPEASAPGASE